jgi:glutamine amidotransferase
VSRATAGRERPLVAVLDYGIGNLRSAQKALERVGADARLTDDPDVVGAAAGGVLPGVGAFGRCMEALRDAGLAGVAIDTVTSGRPFLGICIGQQMLFDGSDEDPEVAGLGVLPGRVRLLPDSVKRPQMQWNVLDVVRPHPLLEGLGEPAWVYFVHSYHPVPDDPGIIVATSEYGTTVTAAVARDNVFATQFHPEKSGRAGLQLLANFVEAVARGALSPVP